MAYVGGGAVAVIAHSLDYYSNAAGTVALIGDGLVVIRVAAAERLFDGALDIIVGHVRGLCLGDDGSETGVIGGISASTLFDCDYHLSGDLGEGLRALGVLRALSLLYVVPLGMSRHRNNPLSFCIPMYFSTPYQFMQEKYETARGLVAFALYL